MKLTKLYCRFYKSFNFDHLRKAHPEAKPYPWENFEGTWYPYVEVPIENDITTVVGANESGKSHLLDAVEKAVTGVGFQTRDLCRYSNFFNVENNGTYWPHLGIAWSHLNEKEAEALKEALKLTAPDSIEKFLMFREGPTRLRVYLPDSSDGYSEYTLEDADAAKFGTEFLPATFRIKANVALPNSVPIDWLINPTSTSDAFGHRRERRDFLRGIPILRALWPDDATQLPQQAPKIFAKTNNYFNRRATLSEDEVQSRIVAMNLARSLLIQLARVDPARIQDLSDAIADGDDGYANALIDRMNDQLAKRINFPKWWVQDRDFSLRVTSHEMDLVFTIMDRTGTEYTFGERSSGLKYFLSYLIQSQVHEAVAGRSEILLMDEPDAFLSADAQQDLLKIFNDFAHPESSAEPIQVLYVTHSPFLIDKNHAERVRVLQKGRGFDGTRVIKNASQNHYEPLRSAFGAFVGETAFIGACNLLVEGVADQIFLAGMARLTRQGSNIESDTLDLNRLVIVPCGSASQVPYMLYLVRGRDADKPAVIVLLDSDKSGDEAAKQIRVDDKRMRRLIKGEYVLQLSELSLFSEGAPETAAIEDLVPLPLAVACANKCIEEVKLFRDGDFRQLNVDEVAAYLGGSGMFDALNAAAGKSGFHIEKLSFARSVTEFCGVVLDDASHEHSENVGVFLRRMKLLFSRINSVRRSAERDASRDKIGTLVDRQQVLFVRDHPEQATKEQALIMLDHVMDLLDESVESDAVRLHVLKLKREFGLEDGLGENLTDYDLFKSRLTALKDSFEVEKASQRNG